MEIKLRERRQAPWPRVLGLDEHFFRRNRFGAEFTTVFTDVGRRKMFEMALSKNNSALIDQTSHIQGRENVELVVMDLAGGYKSFARTMFPQARIVADKFHVLRLLTPALLKARREIHGHRQEMRLRRKLLCSREKLEYFECFDLDRYLSQHPKLAELYHFKERLHQLYRTKGYNRARWALNRLLEEMKASSLPEVQRLRRTLNQWKEEVLEYFRSRFTNAFTEAINAIAKLVQRRACGYRNFKNYRLRTLSACPL
jgi:transposase